MDDHDLLIRIDERTENIEREMRAMQENCRVKTKEISNELGLIKAWKNKIAGAIAIIGALVGSIIILFIELLKKAQ